MKSLGGDPKESSEMSGAGQKTQKRNKRRQASKDIRRGGGGYRNVVKSPQIKGRDEAGLQEKRDEHQSPVSLGKGEERTTEMQK